MRDPMAMKPLALGQTDDSYVLASETVAFDVIGDIVLNTASQQYGGYTIPRVDQILSKYAEMSYNKYVDKYINKCKMTKEDAEKLAWEDTVRDVQQGWQGWEYKFNSVASSRGDYPFITVTMGLATDRFGKMIAIEGFNNHKNGQGKGCRISHLGK